jgi:hypothetical protein
MLQCFWTLLDRTISSCVLVNFNRQREMDVVLRLDRAVVEAS